MKKMTYEELKEYQLQIRFLTEIPWTNYKVLHTPDEPYHDGKLQILMWQLIFMQNGTTLEELIQMVDEKYENTSGN